MPNENEKKRIKRKHTAAELAEKRWLIVDGDIYWKEVGYGWSWKRSEAHLYTFAEAIKAIEGSGSDRPRPIYLRHRAKLAAPPAERWGVWLRGIGHPGWGIKRVGDEWVTQEFASRAEANEACQNPRKYGHKRYGAVPRRIGPDGKPVEETALPPDWHAPMATACEALKELHAAAKSIQHSLQATQTAQGQHRIELTEQSRRIEALESAQRTRGASHASAMDAACRDARAAQSRAHAAESDALTAKVERDLYRRRAEEAEKQLCRFRRRILGIHGAIPVPNILAILDDK